MSQVDALDTPIPFSFEEEVAQKDGTKRKRVRTLSVTPRDFEMESFFQLWLEERELAFVRRHAKRLNAADYDALLMGCARDAASGEFEFGRERVFRALHSPAGWAYNAWLQLRAGDSSVTLELVEKIMKDPEKFRELDAKIARANDPNRGRPAPETGGPAAEEAEEELGQEPAPAPVSSPSPPSSVTNPG